MQRSETSTDRRKVAKPDRGDRLAELAHRVHRLCPDHRNPHRFHEEKSEIAHELRSLSRRTT